MPRKSSFLMGFETGQDLYNKGFQQSQQRAQLKLQRDAADQRKQLLDLQLREANTAQAAREEQAGWDKDAYAAINSMQESLRSTESPEQRHALFNEMQDQYLPRIMRSRKAYGEYGIWRQETILNDPTHKLLQEKRYQDGVVALEEAHAEQAAAKKLRSATREFEKRFNRKPETPLEVMNWVGEEAIRGLHADSPVIEPLPDDFNFDVNKDGRVDSSDARAYKQTLKGKASKETTATGIAKRELDAHYKEREARHEALLEQSAVRVLTQGEILELVKSGKNLDTSSGFGDTTKQKVFQMRAKAANKITDRSTSPVDRVALSAVFYDKLAVGERQEMSQAIGVLGQMKNVKDLYARIDTGPFDAKILEVKKWLDSGEGRDAGELRARLQAIIPGLARGIYGEVGVLTDTDIENYMRTFVALDSSKKLNKVLYESTVDFVEQTIQRKLSNAAGNRLNVSGYLGDMERIGGVNASPNLWGEAPTGPSAGVRPAAEQRPDRPLDMTVNNNQDAKRVAVQKSISTGNFGSQELTMADGSKVKQSVGSEKGMQLAIGYALELKKRGYDWRTHKTEPPEGTPGPARLSIHESLHAEIEAALGGKVETPAEPLPGHDAGNPDAPPLKGDNPPPVKEESPAEPSTSEESPTVEEGQEYVAGKGLVAASSSAEGSQDTQVAVEDGPLGLAIPATMPNHPAWSAVSRENPRGVAVNGKQATLYGNAEDGFSLVTDEGIHILTLQQVNEAMEMGLLKLRD